MFSLIAATEAMSVFRLSSTFWISNEKVIMVWLLLVPLACSSHKKTRSTKDDGMPWGKLWRFFLSITWIKHGIHSRGRCFDFKNCWNLSEVIDTMISACQVHSDKYVSLLRFSDVMQEERNLVSNWNSCPRSCITATKSNARLSGNSIVALWISSKKLSIQRCGTYFATSALFALGLI
jgi:hypothetical protein